MTDESAAHGASWSAPARAEAFAASAGGAPAPDGTSPGTTRTPAPADTAPTSTESGTTTRARIFGRTVPESVIALMWASPFIIFFLFPTLGALSSDWRTGEKAAFLALLGAHLVTYLASWVVNPIAPRSPQLRPVFVATTTLLILFVLIEAGWVWIRHPGSGNGSMFAMLAFAVAAISLQSPRRFLVPLLTLVIVLQVIPILGGNEGWVGLLSCFAGGIPTLFARHSIEDDRAKAREHQRELALSREQERSRISADLHDVLGQTLTAISVKADLGARLLEAGHADRARAEMTALADLARTALADVRAVVSANRTLLPEEEIEVARELLSSVGARLTVERARAPKPGFTQSLVAHAVREAVTNAVRHAAPHEVRITLRERGVTVVNDGVRPTPAGRPRDGGAATARSDSDLPSGTPGPDCGTPGTLASAPTPGTGGGPASSDLPHAGGTGLRGLAARLGGHGTLTWGPADEGHWLVDLEVSEP